jgi:hypothetical protein
VVPPRVIAGFREDTGDGTTLSGRPALRLWVSLPDWRAVHDLISALDPEVAEEFFMNYPVGVRLRVSRTP